MISDATPPNPMAQPQNLRSLTAAIRPNVRIILCPGHWMEGAGSMMAIDEESQNGWFISWEIHENPIYRWMRTGVAPIPGNLQMLWKCNNPLKSRCSRKYSMILLLETAIMFWWKSHGGMVKPGNGGKFLASRITSFFWHCLVFLGPQNWHIYGITREFLVTAGYSRLMNPRIVSKTSTNSKSFFKRRDFFEAINQFLKVLGNLGLKSTFPWIFPTFSEIFFVPSPACP